MAYTTYASKADYAQTPRHLKLLSRMRADMSDTKSGLSVGVDIQSIDEIEQSLHELGDRYRHQIFTDHELTSCPSGGASSAHLAERFAAKEAVLKVLEVSESLHLWRSIEVTQDQRDLPTISLHGTAQRLADDKGVRNILVSLSHAGGIATAVVTATVDTPSKVSGP